MSTPGPEQIDPASLILVQEPVFYVRPTDRSPLTYLGKILPEAFHPLVMANSVRRALYGPASASHSAFSCYASTCAFMSSTASSTTTSLSS